MAEIKVKENMDFFYIESNPISKLLDEIEQRYKYQKILIIGAKEKNLDELLAQRKREIFLLFQDCIDNKVDDIAIVVCFDKDKISECKSYCTKHKLNLILFIDSYVHLNKFCIYEQKNTILGVVINENKIKENIQEFMYNFISDCGLIYFSLVENKISQLYFNKSKKINMSKFFDLTQQVINYFKSTNDFYQSYEQALDLYFQLSMVCYDQNDCYISQLCKDKNCYSSIIIIQIILNIYSLFLTKTTPFLAKSACGGMKDTIFLRNFNENKFWFINNKFKLDTLNIIDEAKNNLNLIKTLCAKVDMEKTFSEAKQMDLNNIKKEIFEVSSVLSEDSLIRVINYFGLLNF